MNQQWIERHESAKDTTAKDRICVEYFIVQRTLFEQKQEQTVEHARKLNVPLSELSARDFAAVATISKCRTMVADHDWAGVCRWCKQPVVVGEELKWKQDIGIIHAHHVEAYRNQLEHMATSLFDEPAAPKRKGKK